MRRPRSGDRTGATFGDVALVLSTLLLAAAIAWPQLRAREREERIARVLEQVEAVRTRAEGWRASTGAWPVQDELAEGPGAPADGTPPDGPPAPRVEWRRLAVAERRELSGQAAASAPQGVPEDEPGPPEPTLTLGHLGLLVVHDADDPILDALLERYGTARSFVHGRSWALVLPRAPAP